MQGLTKTWPGGKKVLDNIHLSFYPDAKIGVLGVNGSGKSTLLRIMAGLDKEFTGEGFVAEGARVGYLPQEPHLDPDLDVRGNVMLGVADKKAILDRYNELAMNYSDETADEMTRLQDEIEAKGLWDLDSQVDQAMDALGCPPDEADVDKLSGGERRRVALCRLLLEQPELLLLDEPTNHLDAETVNWLEGHLRQYPGAILIVTHDRYFLDNVTGWILELDRGRGIPYEGNYSALAEAEAEAARAGRPRGRGAPARARRGKRVDRRLAQGAPGQVQGAHPALRRTGREAERQGADHRPDRHSRRRAARPERHRLRQSVERLRRHAADRQSVVQAAARRHRRRDRPQRRRQDHAVPHDHRPGQAGLRRDQDRRERCSSAMSTSRATRSTTRRPCGRRSPAATT